MKEYVIVPLDEWKMAYNIAKGEILRWIDERDKNPSLKVEVMIEACKKHVEFLEHISKELQTIKQ